MLDQDPPLEKLKIVVNLLNQKHFKQSLSLSHDMLKAFPKSMILFNIIGASNSGLKQFDDAIKSYKKALELNPNYAEAYYNMGIAFKNMGSHVSAIDCYKKALKIQPKYAEANYNMGNALKFIGDLEAAIKSYKYAINNKPDFVEAYNNMGNTLTDMGDHVKAIETYFQAIKIRPNYPDTYKNMGFALKMVVFTEPNSDLNEIISYIIDKKNIIKPTDISRPAINLLKFDPAIKKLLEKCLSGEINESVECIVSDLSRNPLLLKLMSVCAIPDTQLEAAFRDIRYSLIKSVNKIKSSPDLLRFQSALALHCFTNEYVYYQNDKETSLIKSLETVIEDTLLKGEQPKPILVLCLASFKALYRYKWSDLLEITPTINDVVTRQIVEPKQENQLKSDLPTLQKITNQISSKVRDQYENNPYPRWINTGLSLKPVPFSEINKNLKLRLIDKRIIDIEAPNILIAGCGTGQQSIYVASTFKNAKILSVDLSLSSLAYAKRKTNELGIQNIDYMQADILDLSKLNRKFDIIYCSGVLHHMDQPMAGWRSLINCLEEGGLMNIGLYSNLARQHIVKIRRELKQLGIGSDDDVIRSFRRDLINSGEEHHKKIRRSYNFYSLSEIRDLLFHVREHRFTIPEIKDCLAELNIEFCGFGSDVILRDFKQVYSEEADLYNLEKWNQFEEVNQNAFMTMYQFWCQRLD